MVIPDGEVFETGHYDRAPGLPVIDWEELKKWTFYRAVAVEFGASVVLLYVSISVLVTNKHDSTLGLGVLGASWSFGGTMFVIVYCTAGISGGHVNPAITLGLLLLRKITLPCFLFYSIAQCLGAICGAGLVKARGSSIFDEAQGGANVVNHGYTKGDALLAEIIGTFIIMFTVSSALDPKRKARDSHVPVLTPVPIAFAGFVTHLATIPIDNCGINPARSLGPAVIYNRSGVWNEQWIFWVGPTIGASLGVGCHYLATYFHPKKVAKAMKQTT